MDDEQTWEKRCEKIAAWLDDKTSDGGPPSYHIFPASAFRVLFALHGFRILIANETRVYRMHDNGQHTVEKVFGRHEDPRKAIVLAACEAIDAGFEAWGGLA